MGPMALTVGTDFRLPEYRREVFLRFYQFHLKYRAHPGCVYYLMRYLPERLHWDTEQKLWFAFLNGNTQNPVTSFIIMHSFPRLDTTDIGALKLWFDKNWHRLMWDTDRRHHKSVFIKVVERYKQTLEGHASQAEYFAAQTPGGEDENFQHLWSVTRSDKFYSFGRLSAFSYLEYLRIMGVPINCNDLFLEDMSGSQSHRNGLCIVMGRDGWDWHKSNPDFGGRYPEGAIKWLGIAAEGLMLEAKDRAKGTAWEYDTNYFTLESAFCTYKSWHRPNRRYPNVYNDMLHDRIQAAESRWLGDIDLGIFWDARRACLPANLRLEDNPSDVGVKPRKQNHYLNTGQVIMMERDWPEFANDYAALITA